MLFLANLWNFGSGTGAGHFHTVSWYINLIVSRKLFLYEPINANTSFRLFDALVHIQDILIEQFKCKFLFFTSEDPTIKFVMNRSKVQLYDKLKYKFHYDGNFKLTHDGIASALYNGYTLFFVGKKHTHIEFSPIWYIISLKFS